MNPEHVANNVGDNEIVARACRLVDFGLCSRFYASGRFVGGAGYALRGVLRKSAEGAAPQIDPATASYSFARKVYKNLFCHRFA